MQRGTRVKITSGPNKSKVGTLIGLTSTTATVQLGKNQFVELRPEDIRPIRINTLELGAQVKVPGCDMDCRPTIELVRVIRILTKAEITERDHYYDCITQGFDGIKVYGHSKDFI